MIARIRALGYAGSVPGRWQKRGVEALEWVRLAKPRLLWRLRHLARGELPHGLALCDAALAALGIAPRAGGLNLVPATGPVVILANHPTGILDGAALLTALAGRRCDVKVVARTSAEGLPQVTPLILPVPFDHDTDRRQMLRQLAASARAHLVGGGAVAVFPAGRVAEKTEATWSDIGLRLARATQARVVPLRICKTPSRAYQWAAGRHPVLRQGDLLNEVLRHADRPFDMRIGAPIPASTSAVEARRIVLSMGDA